MGRGARTFRRSSTAIASLNDGVGASLLAKNSQTPRASRKHALSLTFFASKLAPTNDIGRARSP
ncbi:hypothetical protein FHP26_01495 [Pseudomonas orientalis]|nr:hypothetical protein [Pseudomonas orientalis]